MMIYVWGDIQVGAHLHDLVWIDEKGLLAPETDLALSTASASAMQS